MSDRRAKGLCYFCDEKFWPAHYLTHKKSQLYLLDANKEEEEDAEVRAILDQQEECYTAHISVNAIVGILDYSTMKVKGVHGKRPVFVLIDLGSTHNFMDTRVVESFGCSVKPPGLARVTVADGGQLRVTGRMRS